MNDKAVEPTPSPESPSSFFAGFIILMAVIGSCIALALVSPEFRDRFAQQAETATPTPPVTAYQPPPTEAINVPTSTPAQVTCVPTPVSPKYREVMDNGRDDLSDNIVWDFEWEACPQASLYQLYVIKEGRSHPFIDITVSGPLYHYINSGMFIADADRFHWTWKVRAMTNEEWGEWSQPVPFDVEPVNTDPPAPTQTKVVEYKLQDPYLGDCENRPAGSVCIKFADGYTWLVYDLIQGSSIVGKWHGRKVIVYYGIKADYYHVLNTSMVKEIPK